MNNDKIQEHVLTVTNPLLIWLFKHGWEEPVGQSHVGQVAIASAIHELANKITDSDMRKQIQCASAKAMANTAAKMVSTVEA